MTYRTIPPFKQIVSFCTDKGLPRTGNVLCVAVACVATMMPCILLPLLDGGFLLYGHLPSAGNQILMECGLLGAGAMSVGGAIGALIGVAADTIDNKKKKPPVTPTSKIGQTVTGTAQDLARLAQHAAVFDCHAERLEKTGSEKDAAALKDTFTQAAPVIAVAGAIPVLPGNENRNETEKKTSGLDGAGSAWAQAPADAIPVTRKWPPLTRRRAKRNPAS